MKRETRLFNLFFPMLLLATLLFSINLASSAPEDLFIRRFCTDREALLLTPSEAGYCSAEGWWIEGIVDDATHWHPPPTHFVTRAFAQDDGVLEATIALKGYDTTGVQGLISLLSPSVAGWRMNIRFPTRPEWGWLLVLNGDAVAQTDHWSHMIIGESGLELSGWLHKASGNIDYWDAERERRYMMVEVCVSMQPERDCATPALDYLTWWKSFAHLRGR